MVWGREGHFDFCLLDMKSVVTSMKGTLREASLQALCGILHGVMSLNVPQRQHIVVAVQLDSDAFSVWQAEVASDGGTV